jgi:STE24 endopeptidase
VSTFGYTFIIVLALATALQLWLGARHIRYVAAHRSAVPAQFAGEVGLEAHQRAADYTAARTRFRLVSIGIDAAVVLWLTFGGGLQWLYDIAAAWTGAGITREVLFVVLLSVAVTLIEVPQGFYRTFVIEQRFGFNKTTPVLFVLDLLKGVFVGVCLGIPLVAAILWLMQEVGSLWWLYAWGVVVFFSLFVTFIAPTVIAPLFNKFSPLDDAEMRERVSRLLARCGFKVKSLMVMDGSRRSAHGNAYFTGFGNTKRIVFFDTLLARLTPTEVEAVLAHELGHFKLKHVVKRLILGFVMTLVFFYLLNYFMHQDWFYSGLGVSTQSTATALVLFYLVVPVFTFLLQPLSAMYSRKHEFEADRYAAEFASAGDLVSALVKLYKDNASTLTPDPVHSAFYDSHPPALIRIARLQQAA